MLDPLVLSVDILRWMFESSRTVTVSKLWWEIDQDSSFKCEDKKFKYEEEIWPIVDFLVRFIELSPG
jgi:hypothetical protein